MSKIYGYARISTNRQKIERQVRNIKQAYPDAIVVKETFTGSTTDRTQFKNLIRHLKQGDTVVFDSVSRMSRNAKEGIELYFDLYKRGINLEFLVEPYINTKTYKKALHNNQIAKTGDKVDIILEAVEQYLQELQKEQIAIAFEQAEKELQDLRQRTKEGIANAKLHGRYSGRKQGAVIVTKKSVKCKEDILRLSKDFNGTIDDKKVIELLGINRNTYYKYKRELKNR